MKKINLVLVVIIAVLGLFTTIGELNKGIGVILKDLSIVLTLITPYLITKFTNIKLTDGFVLIWIIFIFLAHYLGVICCYYDVWPGFDKITHCMSGIMSAYVAYIYLKQTKKTFNALFIVSFASLCAVSWEIFEFICNILVGGDAQKVLETGVDDTMLDMIVALIGSIIFSLYYIIKHKIK